MKTIRIVVGFLPIVLLFACSHPSINKGQQSGDSMAYEIVSINQNDTARYPLMLSNDFGYSWVNASEGLPADLQVSFMEMLNGEMVIASDNMGIFKSDTNLTHWKQIGRDLPGTKINALHVEDSTLFIGVFRQGIFKSENMGKNWLPLSFNLPDQNVQAICTYNNQLVAGTDTGIFILPKKGQIWEPTSVTEQVVSIFEKEGILVAGTSQGTVVSDDGGKSWNWVSREGAVHYTHSVGNRIFELCLNGDLYYSDDWGQHWVESKYEPRVSSYVYEMVKVGDYLVMSNNYGIHQSAENGHSWQLIYRTETMGFFDFLVIGNTIYGGTRSWDEYRKKISNE